EAVQIITRHPLIAVGAAVHGPSFRRMYKEALPNTGRPLAKASFYFCLTAVFRKLADYLAKRAPDERMGIVIEDAPKIRWATGHSYEDVFGAPVLRDIRHRF